MSHPSGSGAHTCPLNPQLNEEQVDYFSVEVQFHDESDGVTKRANLGSVPSDHEVDDIRHDYGGGEFWFQGIKDKRPVGSPFAHTLAGEPKWRELVASTLNSHNIDPKRDGPQAAPPPPQNGWGQPQQGWGGQGGMPMGHGGPGPQGFPQQQGGGFPGQHPGMPQGPVMTPMGWMMPWNPSMQGGQTPVTVPVAGMHYPISPGLPPAEQQAILNQRYEEARRDQREAEERRAQREMMRDMLGMQKERTEGSSSASAQTVTYLQRQLELKDAERQLDATRLNNDITRLSQTVTELREKTLTDATNYQKAMGAAQIEYQKLWTENLRLQKQVMELTAQVAAKTPAGGNDKVAEAMKLAGGALPAAMPLINSLIAKAMGVTPEMMLAAGGGASVEGGPQPGDGTFAPPGT